MDDTDPGVLSDAEVRRIDAQYRGLPAFADWAGTVIADHLWQQTAAILGERKATAGSEALAGVVEQALRTAAVDTGAIEGLYDVDRGFTVSVASMAAAWDVEITQEKGPDVAAMVLAQRRAYDLALDAATTATPISEAWIRRLHEEVCAAQDAYSVRTSLGPRLQALPKGAYKRDPNHIHKADGTEHAFAPVDDTPAEMHRLVEVLRSDQFREAHPVIQAAYAHYALAAVHPFADGNGRVARVLASVYLLRATSLPLVVWADQKADYLDALEAADVGRPQRFVDFVLERAVDLQLEVAERLLTAGAPSVDASLERILTTKITHGGLTHAEIELVAARLLHELGDAVRSELDRVPWPPDFSGQVHPDVPVSETVAGFRAPINHATGFLIVGANPGGMVQTLLQVLVATGSEATFPLRLHRIGHADWLDLRLPEVHPTTAAAARRRINVWVERVVRSALSDFAAQVEQVRGS